MGLIKTVEEIDAEAASFGWAVKFAVPECAIGTLYGESGSFKSFLLLDYMLHRCYGMSWLGQRTKQAIGVYVSAEGGIGIVKRIKAWHLKHDMDWRACPLRVVTDSIIVQKDAERLRKAIKEMGINVGDVALDTFSQTHLGSENDADLVAQYYQMLVAHIVKPFRCTVWVIHHTGHNPDRPRGSYVFIGNSDFIMRVERGTDDRITTLTVEKQKDENKLPSVNFHLTRHEIFTDDDGDPVTSLCASYMSDPADLARAIDSSKSGHKKLLMEVADMRLPIKRAKATFCERHGGDKDAPRKAWSRTLKSLVEAGLVSDKTGILLRCDTGH